MLECAIRKRDTVVAAVRRPETMTKLQTEYTKDRLLVVKVDVSKSDQVNAAFDTVKKAFRRIDVVYNNAGYAIVGEVEVVPLEAARGIFEVRISLRTFPASIDHIHRDRQISGVWCMLHVQQLHFFATSISLKEDDSCRLPLCIPNLWVQATLFDVRIILI